MLDMNISQFMKSLGLEHLRDIFEREQVRNKDNVKNIQCEYKCMMANRQLALVNLGTRTHQKHEMKLVLSISV